ncbi:uncharacterized protein LOC130655024 [Hydractinia symbiolongicarpus]|uniref:uncharacterized protein LOC130655024 n=1 Tax=Hydractinia symbiolongicarpus TaxID=13093 RepID=UPI00254F1F79|nr:uncharacterized protein LOC130655024 [Hydractinia symbiolongicarpus]
MYCFTELKYPSKMISICWKITILVSVMIYEVAGKTVDNNIQKICGKSFFMKHYVSINRVVGTDDLNRLQSCHQTAPLCPNSTLTFVGTYAADSKGRLALILKFENIKAKDCWGFALQWSDNTQVNNVYFNFQNLEKDFIKIVYLKYNQSYGFEVTALPNGVTYNLNIFSPARCEFETLAHINAEIQKKKMFETCSGPGKY